MEGADWASLGIHVCIVDWLGRRYPDRNLGLHAIRPINWAKADKIGGQKSADKIGFWPGTVCPFLTQSGHYPHTSEINCA